MVFLFFKKFVVFSSLYVGRRASLFQRGCGLLLLCFGLRVCCWFTVLCSFFKCEAVGSSGTTSRVGSGVGDVSGTDAGPALCSPAAAGGAGAGRQAAVLASPRASAGKLRPEGLWFDFVWRGEPRPCATPLS